MTPAERQRRSRSLRYLRQVREFEEDAEATGPSAIETLWQQLSDVRIDPDFADRLAAELCAAGPDGRIIILAATMAGLASPLNALRTDLAALREEMASREKPAKTPAGAREPDPLRRTAAPERPNGVMTRAVRSRTTS